MARQIKDGKQMRFVLDEGGRLLAYLDEESREYGLPAVWRASGINERIAAGVAADQTEAEIARVSLDSRFQPGDILRITAVVQTNGLASDVAKFYNLAMGPQGVSYAGATKLATGSGFSQLVATAAGNTRVTYHQLLVLIDSLSSQFFVNGATPVAVVGPSGEAGVLVPMAVDMSTPVDLILGGYFAASAPVGANIKVRKLLVEVL